RRSVGDDVSLGENVPHVGRCQPEDRVPWDSMSFAVALDSNLRAQIRFSLLPEIVRVQARNFITRRLALRINLIVNDLKICLAENGSCYPWCYGKDPRFGSCYSRG